MKQKLFSFGDDFRIRDESGRDIYFVDGKVLTIGNKLSFQDTQGNELAFIRRAGGHRAQTFRISIDGRVVDLSGWQLNGVDFTFPSGTIITNRGYLVIAKNVATYSVAGFM